MMENQIKDLARNTFKQTGDINTFLELIQLENIEKNIEKNIEGYINTEETQYGNYKNQGNYYFRK